ncbi:septation protein SepH [Galbitalea soli]|uniref:DUF3071 domain-containing protein n=1 Tax=Galbitalea soli TaxID=1268042 RepID=A0A7C9PLU2_9MICO|nr:septation protein SepH [Galbitalea soli]NEM90268.1 DUF3071 domain-containing protein [Galbitalea soli]NYJ30976.1 hypothetical protein [Galbitalea soli]
MQDLRVIGVENGGLLVAAEDGTRFRIAIDEVLQSRLRQVAPDPGVGRKVAPKEIQAQIRGGMSAEEVASATGVSLDYVQKFEGPVLAERQYVIDSALAVPVHTALEVDPLVGGSTFGAVIRDRLADLGATGERWASWKDDSGWTVKLAFTASQIDHDARWRFDPRKQALDPANGEAITLSQQGEATGALIPRLRAVGPDERTPDQSRFDSGAFDLIDADAPDPRTRLDAVPRAAQAPRDDASEPNNQTADLLEALRRRRGERESANFDSDVTGVPSPQHPSTGGIRLVDIPLDLDADRTDSAAQTAPQPSLPGAQQKSGRKGRQAMPSWDEIVFGARSDDDLA